jgi:hypothetical protein
VKFPKAAPQALSAIWPARRFKLKMCQDAENRLGKRTVRQPAAARHMTDFVPKSRQLTARA